MPKSELGAAPPREPPSLRGAAALQVADTRARMKRVLNLAKQSVAIGSPLTRVDRRVRPPAKTFCGEEAAREGTEASGTR